MSITHSYFTSILIFFIYIILQMSYSIVSHNFGLSLLGYGYVSSTFYSFLLCTCLYYYVFTTSIYFYSLKLYSTLKFVGFKSTNLIHTSFPLHYIIMYCLVFITSYIYLVSFNPIFNNIFWTSLDFQLFND